MLRRYAFLFALGLCLWAAPVVARADSSCDSVYAQNLARQGYAYLDEHRWSDAKMAAGQLVLYAKNCNDPKVGYPSVIHSAYIGSAALHGLGDDTRAAQAVQMGLAVINVLRNDSQYASLVSAMEPKFAALARELKPVAAAPAHLVRSVRARSALYTGKASPIIPSPMSDRSGAPTTASNKSQTVAATNIAGTSGYPKIR